MTEIEPGKTLAAVRQTWEMCLTPVLCLDQTDHGRFLAVLRHPEDGRYSCHRYVRYYGGWDVSVDYQDAPLESVWAWLGKYAS